MLIFVVLSSLGLWVSGTKTVLSDVVRAANGRFVSGCETFVPVGVNAFWLSEAAAELPVGSFGIDWSAGKGKAAVDELLTSMAALGTSMLWAFSVVDAAPMQTAPGIYDERLLSGLDYAVAAAAQRGIRVSLVLGDWWKYSGGARQYLSWCDATTSIFYTNRCAIEAYKANARYMIGRTNRVSGQPYNADPAIFSWELLNEPIASGCTNCAALLQRWMAEVANDVAAADGGVHMITVGEEGFWSSSFRGASFTGFDADPEPWAAHTGQDFSVQHSLAEVSYASTHLWPSNWQMVGGLSLLFPNAFSNNWVTAHIEAAAALRKPLLLSEFGHYRDDSAAGLFIRGSGTALDFYSSVWAQLEDSVAAGHAGQGDALWVVYPDYARSATAADPYAVYASDEALMARFRLHIARMQAYAGANVC